MQTTNNLKRKNVSQFLYSISFRSKEVCTRIRFYVLFKFSSFSLFAIKLLCFKFKKNVLTQIILCVRLWFVPNSESEGYSFILLCHVCLKYMKVATSIGIHPYWFFVDIASEVVTWRGNRWRLYI